MLSPELVLALLNAAERAEQDATVNAVLLGAEGERFCAGGDLGPGGLMGDGFLAQHQARGDFAVDSGDFRSKHPLGGGCQGDALGGNCGLAMSCHLTVMDPKARIGTPELKVGLFPMMIAPVLMRRIPRAVLHEMILCGLRLSANDALRMGVINRVSDAGEARSSGMELAMSAAQNSRAIVGLD